MEVTEVEVSVEEEEEEVISQSLLESSPKDIEPLQQEEEGAFPVQCLRRQRQS